MCGLLSGLSHDNFMNLGAAVRWGPGGSNDFSGFIFDMRVRSSIACQSLQESLKGRLFCIQRDLQLYSSSTEMRCSN
jgi:hypothetical protein